MLRCCFCGGEGVVIIYCLVAGDKLLKNGVWRVQSTIHGHINLSAGGKASLICCLGGIWPDSNGGYVLNCVWRDPLQILITV